MTGPNGYANDNGTSTPVPSLAVMGLPSASPFNTEKLKETEEGHRV